MSHLELNIVFRGVLYLAEIDEAGQPIVHASGRPAEILIGDYQNAALHPQIDLNCKRCGQAVKGATFTNGPYVQLCRCFALKHHRAGYNVATSESWEAIRKIYDRESLNPAPDNPMTIDPLTGQPLEVTKKGWKFLSKKAGFNRPVEVSQSGKLIKTSDGGSSYTDVETQSYSVSFESEEEVLDLMHAFNLRAGGEPPPYLIHIGNDEDYVFLPETYDIQPRPFRCTHCGVRVHEGKLGYLIDRVASCLCMNVYFRRDRPSAKSSGEWQQFRDQWLKSRIHHKAADADGQS